MNENKQKKYILMTMAIFLFLFLFYKWQVATSLFYLERGDDFYKNLDFNSALKNYKYAITLNGSRDIVYEAKIKKSEIFYRHQKFDEAEKNLLEAIEKKKDDHRAYELLGDIYLIKQQFDEAEKNYDKALKLDNKKWHGLIYLKQFKNLIAARKLDLAYKKLSDLTTNGKKEEKEAFYYLGLFDLYENVYYNENFKKLEKEEGYEKRISEIKKFIEFYDKEKNKDYNDVLLTSLYNKINEPYFALNKISETIKNNPSYRDAWIVSGKSNFIIGNYEKALYDFEQALLFDSNNPEINFWLANIYKKTENETEAKKFSDGYEKLK